DEMMRDADVRDERLVAVEDPRVAVAPRARAHRRDVAARLGLGEREAAHALAAHHLVEHVANGGLFREAERRRAEALHRVDGVCERRMIGELLAHDAHRARASEVTIEPELAEALAHARGVLQIFVAIEAEPLELAREVAFVVRPDEVVLPRRRAKRAHALLAFHRSYAARKSG